MKSDNNMSTGATVQTQGISPIKSSFSGRSSPLSGTARPPKLKMDTLFSGERVHTSRSAAVAAGAEQVSSEAFNAMFSASTNNNNLSARPKVPSTSAGITSAGFTPLTPNNIAYAVPMTPRTREQLEYNRVHSKKNYDDTESFDSSKTGSEQSKKTEDGKKVNLYKTELCRSWEETGNCRYANKCQFAHSLGELRHVDRHPKYKTEMCKTYWDKGTCPYGKRCCFIHKENTSLKKPNKLNKLNISASTGIASAPVSGGLDHANIVLRTPMEDPNAVCSPISSIENLSAHHQLPHLSTKGFQNDMMQPPMSAPVNNYNDPNNELYMLNQGRSGSDKQNLQSVEEEDLPDILSSLSLTPKNRKRAQTTSAQTSPAVTSPSVFAHSFPGNSPPVLAQQPFGSPNHLHMSSPPGLNKQSGSMNSDYYQSHLSQNGVNDLLIGTPNGSTTSLITPGSAPSAGIPGAFPLSAGIQNMSGGIQAPLLYQQVSPPAMNLNFSQSPLGTSSVRALSPAKLPSATLSPSPSAVSSIGGSTIPSTISSLAATNGVNLGFTTSNISPMYQRHHTQFPISSTSDSSSIPAYQQYLNNSPESLPHQYGQQRF